jgi:glucosamine kinase
MKLFLGIDGGGTRTRAFLTDAGGRRSAWGESGPSNPNHASAEEVRTNLERAILGAFHQLEVGLSDCVSVFLGMAGVTTEPGREEMRRLLQGCGLGHTTIGVDHDIRIALAGGLAGQPGIALIVGTGSSCYGRTADGRSWQTGGWEALISDEGSGYYLGREAISAAARMADGRQPESPLQARVFGWLGITRIADVLPRIHDQALSRSEIAAFAPQVIALAESGDAAAQDILDRGAQLLAEMVIANHRRLPTGPHPDVVITGGLGTARTRYRLKIEEAIRHDQPCARIWSPQLAPAVGGALLAMEQAGLPVAGEALESLKAFAP